VIRKLLFGIGPSDPLTFAGVIVLLAVVAVLGSLAPAWRAARVTPLEALRSE
jgi:ABC-type lipoprotein release transport system permease subunit